MDSFLAPAVNAIHSRIKEIIMNTVSWISAIIILVGLFLYGLSLFAAFVLNVSALSSFKTIISSNLGRNVGLPASAVGSFCIVIVFWGLFPPVKTQEGIALELFGLGFTGPTGPVTLWVACFLSFVFSIKILTKEGSE